MKANIQTIKKSLVLGVFALALLLVNASNSATKSPTEDGLWYYEIGGAEPVSGPVNPTVTSFTLGGSVQLGLGYSCAAFDPVVAVSNSLNNIGSGVDDIMNAMTAATRQPTPAIVKASGKLFRSPSLPPMIGPTMPPTP